MDIFINYAFATNEAVSQQNPIFSIAPFLVIMVVFYFFMIRPQQQKQKATVKMLDNLKVGDNVSTISGIIGVIKKIQDDKDIITLEVNKNVEFLIYKKSIATVIENKNQTKQTKKDTKTK